MGSRARGRPSAGAELRRRRSAAVSGGVRPPGGARSRAEPGPGRGPVWGGARSRRDPVPGGARSRGSRVRGRIGGARPRCAGRRLSGSSPGGAGRLGGASFGGRSGWVAGWSEGRGPAGRRFGLGAWSGPGCGSDLAQGAATVRGRLGGAPCGVPYRWAPECRCRLASSPDVPVAPGPPERGRRSGPGARDRAGTARRGRGRAGTARRGPGRRAAEWPSYASAPGSGGQALASVGTGRGQGWRTRWPNGRSGRCRTS